MIQCPVSCRVEHPGGGDEWSVCGEVPRSIPVLPSGMSRRRGVRVGDGDDAADLDDERIGLGIDQVAELDRGSDPEVERGGSGLREHDLQRLRTLGGLRPGAGGQPGIPGDVGEFGHRMRSCALPPTRPREVAIRAREEVYSALVTDGGLHGGVHGRGAVRAQWDNHARVAPARVGCCHRLAHARVGDPRGKGPQGGDDQQRHQDGRHDRGQRGRVLPQPPPQHGLPAHATLPPGPTRARIQATLSECRPAAGRCTGFVNRPISGSWCRHCPGRTQWSRTGVAAPSSSSSRWLSSCWRGRNMPG